MTDHAPHEEEKPARDVCRCGHANADHQWAVLGGKTFAPCVRCTCVNYFPAARLTDEHRGGPYGR